MPDELYHKEHKFIIYNIRKGYDFIISFSYYYLE